MALVDLVKGKDVPRPDKGAQGNIPNDSPAGAGINNVPLSSRIIDGAKDVNPLGSPSGRHLDNGRDVLPQGSPLSYRDIFEEVKKREVEKDQKEHYIKYKEKDNE